MYLNSSPCDMGMGKIRERMGDGVIADSIVSCMLPYLGSLLGFQVSEWKLRDGLSNRSGLGLVFCTPASIQRVSPKPSYRKHLHGARICPAKIGSERREIHYVDKHLVTRSQGLIVFLLISY